MLSVPPTPGQSIVRRPQSDHLYSIGQVLKDAGYATEFLYGGYSYFDNMKNFFSSNGMTVWDQATLSKNEISFSNAWGVCDEDLFDLSIRRADKLSSEGRPFFQIVMTTSNHRPYTYPQKIDVPSGSGRGGAIRYSDYAIGQLIQKSKNKSWFKNTLFVFVADHDASVAGYTKVPVKDFRIPLIFYMPNVIKPEVSSKLGSQIDVAPTILSLLNKSYESHFFGHDLLHSKSERALLGNYQSVGLYKQNILTLLSPNQKIEQFRVATDDSQEKMNDLRGDLIEETISYYQTASWLFSSGLMRAK
jgi:phosphoglycerol transferase MdoB-like AlkP superfamily enzyme